MPPVEDKIRQLMDIVHDGIRFTGKIEKIYSKEWYLTYLYTFLLHHLIILSAILDEFKPNESDPGRVSARSQVAKEAWVSQKKQIQEQRKRFWSPPEIFFGQYSQRNGYLVNRIQNQPPLVPERRSP